MTGNVCLRFLGGGPKPSKASVFAGQRGRFLETEVDRVIVRSEYMLSIPEIFHVASIVLAIAAVVIQHL
jgi:hypothetical protein